jgi:hypothetical protein
LPHPGFPPFHSPSPAGRCLRGAVIPSFAAPRGQPREDRLFEPPYALLLSGNDSTESSSRSLACSSRSHSSDTPIPLLAPPMFSSRPTARSDSGRWLPRSPTHSCAVHEAAANAPAISVPASRAVPVCDSHEALPCAPATMLLKPSTVGILWPLGRVVDEEHHGDCCELCGAEDLESGYGGCQNEIPLLRNRRRHI